MTAPAPGPRTGSQQTGAVTVVGGEHVVYPCTCGAVPGIHKHVRLRHFVASANGGAL